MAYNDTFNAESRMLATFPSKQQLREADALAYAQRRGAVITNPATIPGITTGAALLQEQREFDDANAIRHAQHAATAAGEKKAAKRATCRELAQQVKDDRLDEATLKELLIQMLGKINKLEGQIKSLIEINNEQSELVLKLTKKSKVESRAYVATFDSAGS